MGLSFNAADGGGGEPVEYWREMICRHHVMIEVDHPDGPDFTGRMRIDDWGPIQISDTSFSPVAYEHGSREIRSSDRDDVLCILSLGCGAVFEGAASTIQYGFGDLLIYDTSQLYKLRFLETGRTVSVRIPRPLFTARVPQAGHHFAVRVEGGRPMTILAANLLTNAADLTQRPSDALCREVGSSMLDILCVAVRDTLGEQHVPSPGHAAVLGRVKHGLLERLGDSSLDVETIAEHEGISSRTLNRMFASEGTTVMRWLWSQRLSSSYKALAGGKVRQVTEVAFDNGFKDTSHFTRAFKKQFGVSPNKILAR